MKLWFNNQRGLTLLELLIVLALLSLILVGVFDLVSFVFRSFDRIEGETQRLQAVKVALELLGNDIRNAKPLQNQLIGVEITEDGTQLYLGPDGEGQILYKVNEEGLWRQVHDGQDFKNAPGKLLELAMPSEERPVQLNDRTVHVRLLVDYRESKKSGKPLEIWAEFTVRNGLTKRGE